MGKRDFEIGVVLGSWRSTTDGTTVPWTEIRDLVVAWGIGVQGEEGGSGGNEDCSQQYACGE